MQARFGRLCCRETIRAALHRLDLSWQKAKKLLGRANPQRREAFIEQVRPLLAGAQRDRHRLVYLDEAHIHQDVDLGHGWGERGKRFYVASASPGLSAKVSFYGLYLYNEGQVRLWPYARANGEHTIDVLRRLRVEIPKAIGNSAWELVEPCLERGDAPGQVVGRGVAVMVGEILAQPAPERLHWHQIGAVAGQRDEPDVQAGCGSPDCLGTVIGRTVPDHDERAIWVKDHLDPEEERLRFLS